jgi:hypothetical protein
LYVCETKRGAKTAYKILVEKLEGRRPLEKHRHRWENNMRMNMEVIECEEVDGFR